MSNHLTVSGVAVDTRHYIDGERVSGREAFGIFSPIDQRDLGEISQGDAADCDRAVTAAARAFPGWAALGAEGRLPYLRRFAEEIGKRADDFCVAESNDAGVLLSRMQHGVVPRAMQNILFFAEAALTLQDKTINTKQAVHHVRHDPAGVTVIITPWNAPLMLSTWKIGPALAAGNTVIVKPPEWAPLTCSILADAAEAAGLPRGVFNLVQGSGAVTGAALVSDPRVRRISFTGCILAEIQTAASEAGRFFPLSLAAEGSCTIGGNLATNAGGTAVLRYGNIRELCLGLEVVTAQGEIWDGLRGLRKDNSGYDLRDLFIASEGTLGIITGAVLRLFPQPSARVAAFAALGSPTDAVALLKDARNALGSMLAAFELVSSTSLDMVVEHLPGRRSPFEGESPWYPATKRLSESPDGLQWFLHDCRRKSSIPTARAWSFYRRGTDPWGRGPELVRARSIDRGSDCRGSLGQPSGCGTSGAFCAPSLRRRTLAPYGANGTRAHLAQVRRPDREGCRQPGRA